jgi:hypothetical protein
MQSELLVVRWVPERSKSAEIRRTLSMLQTDLRVLIPRSGEEAASHMNTASHEALVVRQSLQVSV